MTTTTDISDTFQDGADFASHFTSSHGYESACLRAERLYDSEFRAGYMFFLRTYAVPRPVDLDLIPQTARSGR